MTEIIDQNLIPKRRLYTGDTIPAIGLGTFGSDKYTAEQVSEAVYGAINAGFRLIDCASVYQNEALIGTVLKRVQEDHIVAREDLFIISKVWNDMHGQGDVLKSCKQSLKDLQLDYLDMFLIHWPFPNYHAPFCDGDSRNPASVPFSCEEYLNTWRQCEELVDMGLVRHIGMSNMTVSKLKAVLPECKIKPAVVEMECHPSFQQPELFKYAVDNDILPIAYCPMGSPSRPERDRTAEDVVDMQLPEVVNIAEQHHIHPAAVCLKWAVQRGQIPIPFSVKGPQYVSNLKCITTDPLTEKDMKLLESADKNCRLIKGQVFLWEGAKDWTDIWT